MTAALLLMAVAWVSPAQVEEVPTPMDPNVLYYALSTIAQCAAALAALIGFLGLWRLDRLRAEREQALQLIYRRPYMSLGADQEIARLGDEFFVRNAEAYVRTLEQALPDDAQAKLKLKEAVARWRTIPGEQQRLMRALIVFLVGTLVCILPAIVGIVQADWLKAWAWTPSLLYVAGAWLTAAPAYVVWQAARSARILLALLVLLCWASPAMAGGPVRCTTYHEPTLNRWQTLCADGTRAVPTWNRTLSRRETTVTAPPVQACQGRVHKTRQWVGRCR